jgi:hypothetical protein
MTNSAGHTNSGAVQGTVACEMPVSADALPATQSVQISGTTRQIQEEGINDNELILYITMS